MKYKENRGMDKNRFKYNTTTKEKMSNKTQFV
jgi:hypothetical protein